MKYELHITSKGNETHGVLKVDNKVVKRAVAKCHPEDEYDFAMGVGLVIDRLYKKEETLKVGDFVEIVSGGEIYHHLEKGSYGKVIGVGNTFCQILGFNKKISKLHQNLEREDFKKVDITEEEFEAQFKKEYKGKVVCLNPKHNHALYTKGKIYQFENGKLTADDGDKLPYGRVDTFDEWQSFSSSEWLEIVED